jgi:hypothetical protein
MAKVSYVLPEDIEDPELQGWLTEAIEAGKPGPENQSIRAHNPVVMRSFTLTRKMMQQEGVLEKELREVLRSYIALSLDCPY